MKIQNLSDKMAVALSFLCLVHCLFLPLVIILIPSLTLTFLSDEMLHKVLLVAILPISVVALLFGFKKHGNTSVLYTIVCGLAVLCVAAFAGHELLGEMGEVGLTVFGSILVALGHFRNTRLNPSNGRSREGSLVPDLSER